jgi:hypothetical protein
MEGGEKPDCPLNADGLLLATIALVGPMWWLVATIATGQTPYDRWALARVGRSTDHENRSGSGAEK